MLFEESSLYLEVEKMIEEGEKPVFYNYQAIIHLKEEDIDALKIISIDYKREYDLDYSEEIMLSLFIPWGQYSLKVYPERNNLEITIKKKPMKEHGEKENEEEDPIVERYVAVLVNQENPILTGDGGVILREDALDLSQLNPIEFQLIPKSVDQMRMISVGGIYREATTEDVVKAILTKESQNLDLSDELKPKGVHMVESNMNKEREHIIIPQGTKLVDLPTLIQNKCGGIYSSGLGFFYQDKHWYLFPSYDTTRYEDTQEKITIINVPQNKLVGFERTYREEGDSTIILATGNVQFIDNSDRRQLQYGNGLRYADASLFMEDFSETKDNKTKIARGENANEVLTTERESEKQNVHVVDRRISANPAAEYSSMAFREGAIFSLLWENADPEIIYPGVPVKLLYLLKDEVKEIYGVVIKAHIYTHIKGQVMFASTHYTNIGLVVFVNRKDIEWDTEES